MKDVLGIMKKAGQMQAKMQEMQDNVANAEFDGVAGGGLVTVTLTGKGEVRNFKIDPSLVNPDEVEILEDLITAAFNDGRKKVEAFMDKQMGSLAGDLNDPDAFKLPS